MTVTRTAATTPAQTVGVAPATLTLPPTTKMGGGMVDRGLRASMLATVGSSSAMNFSNNPTQVAGVAVVGAARAVVVAAGGVETGDTVATTLAVVAALAAGMAVVSGVVVVMLLAGAPTVSVVHALPTMAPITAAPAIAGVMTAGMHHQDTEAVATMQIQMHLLLAMALTAGRLLLLLVAEVEVVGAVAVMDGVLAAPLQHRAMAGGMLAATGPQMAGAAAATSSSNTMILAGRPGQRYVTVLGMLQVHTSSSRSARQQVAEVILLLSAAAAG